MNKKKVRKMKQAPWKKVISLLTVMALCLSLTVLPAMAAEAGSGLLGDGLSTALFVMGRERAEAYWRTHGGFEFVLLTETGRAVISEGLEGCFHLYGEWENRPVEVVRR